MPKDTEIRVKAECVDIRTGKRYAASDTFDPLPTEDQAARLVAAGCLPKEAITIAAANDAALASASDAEKPAAAKAAEAARKRVAEAEAAVKKLDA